MEVSMLVVVDGEDLWRRAFFHGKLCVSWDSRDIKLLSHPHAKFEKLNYTKKYTMTDKLFQNAIFRYNNNAHFSC